jgi:hypothetical protein
MKKRMAIEWRSNGVQALLFPSLTSVIGRIFGGSRFSRKVWRHIGKEPVGELFGLCGVPEL